MISFFRFSPVCSGLPGVIRQRRGIVGGYLLIAAIGLILGFGGCRKPDAVQVGLQADSSREHDPRRLIIRAQVTGPQERLSYHWFSQTGECVPQRTDSPGTTFYFAEGQGKDQVILEVWRGNQRVAQSEIAVTLPSTLTTEKLRSRPKVQIELTDKPPYDPVGGPGTRSHIGGVLTGELGSPMVVIIYARVNDVWFVQPSAEGAKTLLRSDNSFSNWTHTGANYAVLVARPSFTPLAAAEFLPLVEGDIIAHVIFEGERN